MARLKGILVWSGEDLEKDDLISLQLLELLEEGVRW
jgi:hypothetical protein